MSLLGRLIPVLLLAAFAAALYASGLSGYLTLDSLQAHEAALREAAADRRWAVVAAFIGLFMVVTAAGVPVALLLTLAAGFILGPLLGGAATVIGATLGATVTYYAARSALRGPLRRQADRRRGALKRLVDGFGRDAFSYVLTLRLIPLCPFALVNVAAGVAGAPVRPFVLATAVGAVPTSLIYASLGAGLGHVFASGAEPNLSVVLEPHVFWPLLGLAALALVPTVIRRRRAACEPKSEA